MGDISELFEEALTHHQAGRAGEAAALYEQALATSPNHTGVLFNLAALVGADGRLDLAAEYYERILLIRPDDPETLTNYGNVLSRQGRADEAEVSYRKAIEGNPTLDTAWLNLGNACFNGGRMADAVENYRHAISLNPGVARAHSNLGAALHGLGRLEEAHECFEAAARREPGDAEYRYNLGTILLALGREEEALGAFHKAREIHPDHFEALQESVTVLINRGEMDDALELLERCVELRPDDATTAFRLGTLLHGKDDNERAVTMLRHAAALQPGSAEVHNNLGLALTALHRYGEALEAFCRAVDLRPEYPQAHNNLGHLRLKQNEFVAALACFERALELDPDLVIAAVNIGLAYHGNHETERAQAWFERALEIDPELPAAHNGLGIILQQQNRQEEAIERFQRAVTLRPDYVEALNNLAISMQETGRIPEAIEYYRDVLVHEPGRGEVYFNLGNLLQSVRRLDESIAVYSQAIRVQPDYHAIYPYLCHSLMQTCSWANLDSVIAKIIENVERDLDRGDSTSVSPFGLQGMPASMALRQRVAAHVAERAKKNIAQVKDKLRFDYRRERGRRLKIGYVSPDFRYHSVGLAIQGVLEHHDRERFEIYGYSIATLIAANDTFAPKLRDEFEHFLDGGRMSHEALAQRINDDGIDVLIDLAGHTRGSRPALFALQPAPVQAHYLGFSTTTGADYIQYLISDPVFMPPEMAAYCTEEILYLPDSFFATTRAPIDETPTSRAREKLPEEGFVLANFNSHYKMHPELFSVWMRLLRRVPGSVLWLIEGSDTTRQNLSREAENRGVDPNRLVFAPHRPHPLHLARHRLADLVVDHMYHGGGVTTIDALWVGVPTITIAGATPAGRNGADLLNAIGMPDLVAGNVDEYERLAHKLATDRAYYRSVRARLEGNRDSEPLFDGPRLTRHLELGYEMMWDNWAGGNEPRTMSVPALPKHGVAAAPTDRDV